MAALDITLNGALYPGLSGAVDRVTYMTLPASTMGRPRCRFLRDRAGFFGSDFGFSRTRRREASGHEDEQGAGEDVLHGRTSEENDEERGATTSPSVWWTKAKCQTAERTIFICTKMRSTDDLAYADSMLVLSNIIADGKRSKIDPKRIPPRDVAAIEAVKTDWILPLWFDADRGSYGNGCLLDFSRPRGGFGHRTGAVSAFISPAFPPA
jgi:hypothetical protein